MDLPEAHGEQPQDEEEDVPLAATSDFITFDDYGALFPGSPVSR